jgi:hypothetical protein
MAKKSKEKAVEKRPLTKTEQEDARQSGSMYGYVRLKREKKKEELMPAMKEDVDKGLAHVLLLTAARQKALLRHYFDYAGKGHSNMNKADVKLKLEAYFSQISTGTND